MNVVQAAGLLQPTVKLFRRDGFTHELFPAAAMDKYAV